MNVRLAQHALARHFNYFSQTVVPNVYFCGGEMDVAIVTRSGYLVEVELKASLDDWNADRTKEKWLSPDRKLVSRFYYAVPTELINKVPKWVPDERGLIELRTYANGPQRVHAIERRRAIKVKAPTMSHKQMRVLLDSTYHRFWRRELLAVT